MERDLGEFLLQRGIITPEQLQKARQVQEQTRQSDLARVLVELGFITETVAAQMKAARRQEWQAHAQTRGLSYIDLDHFWIDPSAVNVVPSHIATQHRIIPIGKTDRALTVATSHPGDVFAQDDVRLVSGLQVQWVVADPEAIDRAIARHYGPV